MIQFCLGGIGLQTIMLFYCTIGRGLWILLIWTMCQFSPSATLHRFSKMQMLSYNKQWNTISREYHLLQVQKKKNGLHKKRFHTSWDIYEKKRVKKNFIGETMLGTQWKSQKGLATLMWRSRSKIICDRVLHRQKWPGLKTHHAQPMAGKWCGRTQPYPGWCKEGDQTVGVHATICLTKV